MRLDESSDSLERFDVLILPYAEVARRDASFLRNARGLNHDQTCAAHGPASQVNQMPVIGEAILGGILAHRGDADPVGEYDVAERSGENRFGSSPASVRELVWAVGRVLITPVSDRETA